MQDRIDAETRPDEHRSERVANDSTGPDDEAVEGSWSPRRPQGSAAKSSAKPAKADQQPDPDVLVEEIEKTREELAETLDAIADKVSPKRVADRTKKAAKDGANDAKDSVKETAAEVADTVKSKVAEVKEKVSGDGGAPKSPLAPATSVELDAAPPVPGAEVPVEPAPTPGALADSALVAVEPAGTEAPVYTTTLPPQQPPSRLPMLAGAGAALGVVLLLAKRRRGRRRRR